MSALPDVGPYVLDDLLTRRPVLAELSLVAVVMSVATRWAA